MVNVDRFTMQWVPGLHEWLKFMVKVCLNVLYIRCICIWVLIDPIIIHKIHFDRQRGYKHPIRIRHGNSLDFMKTYPPWLAAKAEKLMIRRRFFPFGFRPIFTGEVLVLRRVLFFQSLNWCNFLGWIHEPFFSWWWILRGSCSFLGGRGCCTSLAKRWFKMMVLILTGDMNLAKPAISSSSPKKCCIFR